MSEQRSETWRVVVEQTGGEHVVGPERSEAEARKYFESAKQHVGSPSIARVRLERRGGDWEEIETCPVRGLFPPPTDDDYRLIGPEPLRVAIRRRLKGLRSS